MASFNRAGNCLLSILFSSTIPSPDLAGSTCKTTCPYWFLLFICLSNVPSCVTAVDTVSLYDTCGLPNLTGTLNSLFILSAIISRWSSPTPLIITCPLSSSYLYLKVGSSSSNFFKASINLSWSAAVFVSMDWLITGSAKSIFS